MSISYPLSMPSSPTAFRGMRLIGDSRVALDDSPFTGEQQVQDWGGKLWRFQAALPPMKRAEAEEWAAFLLKLNGPRYTFLAGDPLGATARGALGGTPTAYLRRNKALYSQDFTQGGTWAAAFANPTRTANATTAPDGTNTGNKLEDTDGGNWSGVGQTITIPNNTATHFATVFCKIGTTLKSWVRLVYYNGGVTLAGIAEITWATLTVQALGDASSAAIYRNPQWEAGWYRVSVGMANNGSGNVSADIQVFPATNAVGETGYAYFWGAQFNPDFVVDYAATTTVEVTSLLSSGQVLYTGGWTPSVANLLRAGDYIQVGSGSTSRLYKVLVDIDSDPWGLAPLDIWPSLREIPASGASVVTSSCKGVFRLAQRLSPWDMDHQGIYGIAFEAVEAI